jgi:hypothetical protein
MKHTLIVAHPRGDAKYLTIRDLDEFITRVKSNGGDYELVPEVRISWSGNLKEIAAQVDEADSPVDYSE